MARDSKVIFSAPQWEVIQVESGDIHVLPVGEEHDRSPDCSCLPRVDIEGAALVIVHNAFDFREIVEDAISIMNGEEQ